METQLNQKTMKKLRPEILLLIFLFVVSQGCQMGDDTSSDFSGGEGTGGSMARFTIANNHLYTVDQSTINVFDLSNPETPEFKIKKQVGFGVETIFPLNNNLFLGTSTGMYIYDVNNPVLPKEISFFEHVVSCDPVVSDGDYAYVTLSSSNQTCWRWVNELQIIDLHDLGKPKLVKQYELDCPRGLAVRNDTLWVCDNGIKIFDATDKMDIKLLYHFSDIVAYDVILKNELAFVIGETGFNQYKFENDTIIKLSEINVQL
jgi:hypothetical protein